MYRFVVALTLAINVWYLKTQSQFLRTGRVNHAVVKLNIFFILTEKICLTLSELIYSYVFRFLLSFFPITLRLITLQILLILKDINLIGSISSDHNYNIVNNSITTEYSNLVLCYADI